jgi:septum formation protein
VSAILLASASPRRRELLGLAGLTLTVAPADVDETPLPDEAPDALARRLAAKKARAIAERHPAPRPPIIAADTVVVVHEDGRPSLLGKPRDAGDARIMLGRLAGKTHEVMTAFHIVHEGRERGRVVTTEVSFRPLTAPDLDGYVGSGEWEGKAGGYAIQGLAGAFVRTIRGSYTNVVGLPLCEVLEDLVALGALPADWAQRLGPRAQQ